MQPLVVHPPPRTLWDELDKLGGAKECSICQVVQKATEFKCKDAPNRCITCRRAQKRKDSHKRKLRIFMEKHGGMTREEVAAEKKVKKARAEKNRKAKVKRARIAKAKVTQAARLERRRAAYQEKAASRFAKQESG